MDRPTFAIDALLEGVDAVLFDMDGVLLDTEDLYTEATKEVLGPCGERFDFRVKERIMGREPLLAAKILLEAVGSTMDPEEFFRVREPVITRLFSTCPAIPGAPELVRRLAERGMPMAVATSSARKYFKIKTTHHPWFRHFKAVVCGSDEQVGRHKPFPDIFLAAARAVGSPIDRCLILEDSPAGIEAALAARPRRIIARWDPRMDRQLLAGSDVLLTGYEQIDF